ncbi:RNA recognition motif [Aphelenchoides fujianensis]|nr:RNA recognition motif [Aphelenchoides fujianensis]
MAYQGYNFPGGFGGYGAPALGGMAGAQAGDFENSGAYNARYHFAAAQNAGFQFGADDTQPRILYVGNLDASITEEFINTLFGQIGRIIKTKVIFDTGSDPYAFVEFADHMSASQALQAMNKRMLLDKEMKVNWATQPGSQQKVDTSRHFHVFVGDLSPEVDNKTLKEAFVPFGEVSEAKVIRDPATQKSKGYGFISYPKREEAERAIDQMNGQWLGRRTIRTNWATRKPAGGDGGDHRGSTSSGGGYGERHHGRQSLEEIMAQTSPDNTCVYVGNVASNATDEDVRAIFTRFGHVQDIRHFKVQGYSFVRFDSKENAARAIFEMNGAELMNQAIRCSWGKSDNRSSSAATDANAQQMFGGAGGYPAGFPGGANPQQQQQFWQYYQHYYQNPAVQQQWGQYWSQQPGGQGPPPPSTQSQPQH